MVLQTFGLPVEQLPPVLLVAMGFVSSMPVPGLVIPIFTLILVMDLMFGMGHHVDLF